MNQYLLIGVAAGLASALLNLSGYSGGMIGFGFILVLLSTLPIMIASLGWGSFTGLIAAMTSGLTLAIFFNLTAGFIFLVLNCLPAWWIAHIAGLSRDNQETGEREFYPLGHLLMWIAGLASLATMAMFIPFGFSLGKYRDAISTLVNQLYKAQDMKNVQGAGLPVETLIDIVVRLAPTASSVMLVISTVITLYLAAKVVQRSDRLTRPWPKLDQVTMPAAAAFIFMIALLGASLDGLLGIFAQIIASGFGAALMLVGLSVLHFLTRSIPSRGLILWTSYFLLVVFQWLAVFLIILGASEILINIRARFTSRPPQDPNDPMSGSN